MKEKEGRSRKKPREPHSDDLDREAKRGMERKRQRKRGAGHGNKEKSGFSRAAMPSVVSRPI